MDTLLRATPRLPAEAAPAPEPSRLDLPALLARSGWYHALPPEARDWVAPRFVERFVPRGQLVGGRGEIPSCWFGLVDGVLKSSVLAADGRVSNLGGILPGAWFGEGGLLRARPRHGDYVALRDSRVAELPLDDFSHLLQSQPAFKDFVLMQVTERLHYFMDQLGEARLLRAPAQVAYTLCGLAHPLNNPLGLRHLPISQDELAAIAGVSRQRCNQALAHMRAAGWLQTGYGGLTLLDLGAIATMARDARGAAAGDLHRVLR
ncbi:MAG: Crp/Fnr family transcriptional regulator [Variovorax sp.]|nr:Crp/Fnr family transcriptional regulator [Variovorax sp.]